MSLAEKLDPLSPVILKDKGVILYYSRDYNAAITYAQKALELDRDFVSAHRILSMAYQGKGHVRGIHPGASALERGNG